MKHIKNYSDFFKVNEEAEGASYKAKLEEIIKDAQEIASMINDGEDLEAWVQDKIAIANSSMHAIKGYLQTGDTGVTK